MIDSVLPSWRVGATRTAIVDVLDRADVIPPTDRVAVNSVHTTAQSRALKVRTRTPPARNQRESTAPNAISLDSGSHLELASPAPVLHVSRARRRQFSDPVKLSPS